MPRRIPRHNELLGLPPELLDYIFEMLVSPQENILLMSGEWRGHEMINFDELHDVLRVTFSGHLKCPDIMLVNKVLFLKYSYFRYRKFGVYFDNIHLHSHRAWWFRQLKNTSFIYRHVRILHLRVTEAIDPENEQIQDHGCRIAMFESLDTLMITWRSSHWDDHRMVDLDKFPPLMDQLIQKGAIYQMSTLKNVISIFIDKNERIVQERSRDSEVWGEFKTTKESLPYYNILDEFGETDEN
jgi:hypothetical protein